MADDFKRLMEGKPMPRNPRVGKRQRAKAYAKGLRKLRTGVAEKTRLPGEVRAYGKEARAHKVGRNVDVIRNVAEGGKPYSSSKLRQKAYKRGIRLTERSAKALERRQRISEFKQSPYGSSQSPRPVSGFARLGKVVEKLGKGMKVFAPIGILQGTREWKEQGGPSASELIGIKKYKRRPRVRYGEQEM